jgi:hypothetical protein
MHSLRGFAWHSDSEIFGTLRNAFATYRSEGANLHLRRKWVPGSSPMENLSEVSGYVASTLVLFTFVAKDMRLLRTVAIFSNLAFIVYGTIEWLPPVLFLHLVLLPLNIVRLAEVVRATRSASDSWVPKLWAQT